MLPADGRVQSRVTLFNDLSAGQRPQYVVPWHLADEDLVGAKSGRCLVELLGTTVAPGFDFTDYGTW